MPWGVSNVDIMSGKKSKKPRNRGQVTMMSDLRCGLPITVLPSGYGAKGQESRQGAVRPFHHSGESAFIYHLPSEALSFRVVWIFYRPVESQNRSNIGAVGGGVICNQSESWHKTPKWRRAMGIEPTEQCLSTRPDRF